MSLVLVLLPELFTIIECLLLTLSFIYQAWHTYRGHVWDSWHNLYVTPQPDTTTVIVDNGFREQYREMENNGFCEHNREVWHEMVNNRTRIPNIHKPADDFGGFSDYVTGYIFLLITNILGGMMGVIVTIAFIT